MKLSNNTINQLVKYVVGDDHAPYRTGVQLIELFNKYGGYDYLPSDGLPMMPNSYLKYSRKSFAEKKMAEMSGKDCLRQLLEDVINHVENANAIEDIAKLLSQDGYGISKKADAYKINGGVIDNSQPIENNVHFEDLQKQVIDAIDKAKVSINIAMAWFTNEQIKDKLVEKKEAGVDVDIIIYDDEINNKHGVDLSSLPHTFVKGSKNGIMHDKFCVIDNQTVICGSYNWTKNAETRNDEFVTILKDPDNATNFTLEFKKLKQ